MYILEVCSLQKTVQKCKELEPPLALNIRYSGVGMFVKCCIDISVVLTEIFHIKIFKRYLVLFLFCF